MLEFLGEGLGNLLYKEGFSKSYRFEIEFVSPGRAWASLQRWNPAKVGLRKLLFTYNYLIITHNILSCRISLYLIKIPPEVKVIFAFELW